MKNKSLLFFMGVWLAWAQAIPAAMSSGIWLETYRKNHETTLTYAFDFESIVSYRTGQVSDTVPIDWKVLPQEAKITGHMAVDARHGKITEDFYRGTGASPTYSSRKNVLWDGRRVWYGQQAPLPDLWPATYAFSAQGRPDLLANEFPGGFLDGYFTNLPFVRWTDLLKDEMRADIAATMETVDGFPCRRVTGRLAKSTFTLWVDDQHGNNLRRAEFTYLPPNPFRWKRYLPVKQPNEIAKIEIWIQDIKLQDRPPFMPVSGVMRLKTTMSTGEVFCQKIETVRRNLRIGPVSPDEFRSIVPEGAPVTDSQYGIVYLWQGGALTPWVNPEAGRKADSAIQQVSGMLKSGALRLWPGHGAAASSATLAANWDSTVSRQALSANPSLDPVEPVCGLYCLYVALGLSGRPAALTELIKPEYASDPIGGGYQGLIRAARRHGLFPKAGARLVTPVLKKMDSPMVLHIKRDATSRRFDGYELYLGQQDRQALLYSPVKGLRREPWEVLASRWDGTALALGLQPLGRWRLLGPVALRYAAIVLLGAVLMAGVWLALCRWRRLPRLRSTLRASVFEFVVLAVLSGAVALLWHWLGPEGFLARTGATDHVRVARMGYFLPRVDRGGVSRVVEGKDRAVILDARDGESYYAGHIPGAINVPVELNTALRVKKMGKTAKGERIIVYCGSEECGLARLMAASLYHAGYTNLQIYPGGWKEWDAWQETQAPRRGRVVNAGGVGLP